MEMERYEVEIPENSVRIILLGLLVLMLAVVGIQTCRVGKLEGELAVTASAYVAATDTLETLQVKHIGTVQRLRTIEGDIKPMLELNADNDSLTRYLADKVKH